MDTECRSPSDHINAPVFKIKRFIFSILFKKIFLGLGGHKYETKLAKNDVTMNLNLQGPP